MLGSNATYMYQKIKIRTAHKERNYLSIDKLEKKCCLSLAEFELSPPMLSYRCREYTRAVLSYWLDSHKSSRHSTTLMVQAMYTRTSRVYIRIYIHT